MTENSERFTWIPFYMELADKLREFRDNRALLIEKITAAFAKSGKSLPKLDEGEPIDIDPFTVFALFNKSLTDSNRITIIKGLADEFDLTSEIPDDFFGIPVMTPLQAVFFGFGSDRKDNDIDNLWSFFIAALDYADNGTGREEFCRLFNIVIKQYCVSLPSLSMGLFWVRPYMYLNFDGVNQLFLKDKKNVPESVAELINDKMIKRKNYDPAPDAEIYLQVCELCLKELQTSEYEYKDFPSLSFNAWKITKKDNSITRCWFVGAYSDADDTHFDKVFIEKGIWQNGYTDKFLDAVNSVRVGDKIAIKTTYTKKKGLPFDNNGETISVMYIKYVGTVTANHMDGRTLDVDWDTSFSPREWYFYTFRNTISLPKEDDWRTKALIDFVFNNVPQDYNKFSKDDEPYTINEAIISVLEKADRGMSLDEIYEEIVANKLFQFDTKKNTEKAKVDAVLKKRCKDVNVKNAAEEKLFYICKTENGINYYALIRRTEIDKSNKPYTKQDFLKEVYITEPQYDTLKALLIRKKNIILQGAPGVGKTFAAKRLAWSVMGEKDNSRIEFVQFHQSYSYEDFIMGYRPADDGKFELKEGVFYRFCEKAGKDTDRDYFFIIDEINRGNLSKIFGELLMLIETDKRGEEHKMKLVYNEKPFYIPKNLHIIGMMNTADRSLAMIDYALRRRFSFYTMTPSFDNAKDNGFGEYIKDIDCELYRKAVEQVARLNEKIRADSTLGKGFEIGHSYFSPTDKSEINDDWVKNVIAFEIVPLIEEYWFDDEKKAEEEIKALYDAIGEKYDGR